MSEGLEGPSERPATEHGQPRTETPPELHSARASGFPEKGAAPLASDCGVREGLPVLREPAYADERSQDGEATAASE